MINIMFKIIDYYLCYKLLKYINKIICNFFFFNKNFNYYHILN